MKVLAALLVDAVGLAGVGLVVFGVHQVYPPAAFIVGGAALTAGALVAAAKRGRR